MALFTSEDRAQIEASIADVERHTAAEIVVTTVARSDRYTDVRLLFGALVALACATLAHLIWPQLTIGELLALQPLVGLASYAGAGIPGVLRMLTREERREEAVERAAQLAFLRHEVFNTRDRMGVLILLSELEHKVTILGDAKIHHILHEAGWSSMVTKIVAAIREGHPARGICAVVRELGEVLAREAPVRPDDVNELSNRVREDDSPA